MPRIQVIYELQLDELPCLLWPWPKEGGFFYQYSINNPFVDGRNLQDIDTLLIHNFVKFFSFSLPYFKLNRLHECIFHIDNFPCETKSLRFICWCSMISVQYPICTDMRFISVKGESINISQSCIVHAGLYIPPLCSHSIHVENVEGELYSLSTFIFIHSFSR